LLLPALLSGFDVKDDVNKLDAAWLFLGFIDKPVLNFHLKNGGDSGLDVQRSLFDKIHRHDDRAVSVESRSGSLLLGFR